MSHNGRKLLNQGISNKVPEMLISRENAKFAKFFLFDSSGFFFASFASFAPYCVLGSVIGTSLCHFSVHPCTTPAASRAKIHKPELSLFCYGFWGTMARARTASMTLG